MDSISLDSLSLDKIALPKLPSFKFGSDEQWPSYGKNLSNQRFSTLTQINQDNVKNLELAWKFKSGVAATFQASPLVINNVMFISLPHNHVVALDAKTGKELWRYSHKKEITGECVADLQIEDWPIQVIKFLSVPLMQDLLP